jgi:hypothetical protein
MSSLRRPIGRAVANPRRAHTPVGDSWQLPSFLTIGKALEVQRKKPIQVRADRFVRESLELNGSGGFWRGWSNHESDSCVSAEVE